MEGVLGASLLACRLYKFEVDDPHLTLLPSTYPSPTPLNFIKSSDKVVHTISFLACF